MRILPPLLALCLGASLCMPPSALANGRFPAAQQVVVGPGASEDVIALRTTFGFLVSRDRGAHFQWLCEEAIFAPQQPSEAPDPALVVNANGTVSYGFEWGVRRIDSCAITNSQSVADRVMVDLAADPAGQTVWAVEGLPGEPNALFRASTNDLVFERLAAPDPSLLFLTVDVAPTNSQRLYLSGIDNGLEANPRLLRSDDGGRTLRELPALPREVGSAFVSAVSPQNPDVVFVRALVGTGTALYRTSDGGQTFSVVARFQGSMLGFAHDTGANVWIGGPTDGLHVSHDDGLTFERVSDFPVYCLTHHASALYVCADWVVEPFAIGRSTDGGQRFEPFLRFEDVDGTSACGIASEVQCPSRWPTYRQFFLARDGDASTPTFPRDVVRPDIGTRVDTGSRDAGRNDAGDAGAMTPPETRSCQCEVGAVRSKGGAWWALVGVALIRCLRRGRRAWSA